MPKGLQRFPKDILSDPPIIPGDHQPSRAPHRMDLAKHRIYALVVGVDAGRGMRGFHGIQVLLGRSNLVLEVQDVIVQPLECLRLFGCLRLERLRG